MKHNQVLLPKINIVSLKPDVIVKKARVVAKTRHGYPKIRHYYERTDVITQTRRYFSKNQTLLQ